MQHERFTAPHLEQLAQQAERFMLTCYERLPHNRVLHNDSWALTLAGHAREIALRKPGAGPDLPPLVTTVALLEACRYWGAGYGMKTPAAVAQEFREWAGPDYLPLQLTLASVLPDGHGSRRREVADVLFDAQLAQRLLAGGEGAELAWLEERYRNPNPPGRAAFLAGYLEELRGAAFRDGELRRRYQNTYSSVLLDLQRLVDKLGKRSGGARPGSLTGLEGGPTRQAAQTYFRTMFQNHMQMSTIADQKAAIMISVNALLIGAAITFISYRNWGETKPIILLPISLFVVCGLISLTYAVFSARPALRANEGENLAFYGSFSRLTVEEYAQRLERTLLDADALYGTLSRELYFLGTTLERRYEMLRMAYSIFLVGIVTSTVILLGVILF